MKKFNIYTILKVICIVLCAVFLLSACNGEGLCDSEAETQKNTEAVSHDCWQKEFLSVFYNSTGKLSLNAYRKITDDTNLLALMVVIFTAWMAFQILRHVATTSPESIGEFWNKIIRKATLCFVCGTLAASTDGLLYTLNTFIFPIYTTLLEFAAEILRITNPEATTTSILIGGEGEGAFQICERYDFSQSGVNGTCSLSGTQTFSTDAFPDAPLNLMGCMVCSIASRLNSGYSIAMRLLCLDSVIGVLVAILLVVAFTIAKLCFVLYMADSVFRMDMMLVALPFLIMFFPFEQTRKWSALALKYILNSAAIMLCLVVVVSLTILAMEKILVAKEMGINYTEDEFSSLGPSPIAIMFLGFVIIKASGMSLTLANSIIGGGGSAKLQKKVKAIVGTLAKFAFELVTWGAGKGVTAIINRVARLRAAAEKIKKARDKYRKLKSAAQRLAGRNQR